MSTKATTRKNTRIVTESDPRHNTSLTILELGDFVDQCRLAGVPNDHVPRIMTTRSSGTLGEPVQLVVDYTHPNADPN